MSSLNAALLVIGILICVGGPLLWWVFFRMDEHPTPPAGEPLLTGPIAEPDLLRIESSLGVKLPEAYRKYLGSPRTQDIDEESIFGDADLIISATQEYREGFGGNPPWPGKWVYVGDEADACPYAIDVESGEVIQTDHGNPERKPLENFASFREFTEKFD